MPAALACLPWLAVILAAPQTAAEKRSPGWDLWRQGQQATQDGKYWIASLYANVFAVEHNALSLGPETGPR